MRLGAELCLCLVVAADEKMPDRKLVTIMHSTWKTPTFNSGHRAGSPYQLLAIFWRFARISLGRKQLMVWASS